MHRIYFENRCICICKPDDQALADPNSVEFHPGGPMDITMLVDMFEKSAPIGRVYIPAEDCEGMYRRLCSEFREVDAAGGLVENRRGDYLLISRNGLWDLPKGHREAGEDILTTAVREVQEETGVERLVAGELICVTDHCYFRNEVWHLKHTWWYRMRNDDPEDLSPQREEDIAKAVWVAKSSLPPYLKNTYPSIQEVFRQAKV